MNGSRLSGVAEMIGAQPLPVVPEYSPHTAEPQMPFPVLQPGSYWVLLSLPDQIVHVIFRDAQPCAR
jgi:hypothetical protein